ncbi:MAG: hypothetical protein ACR2QC_06245 [Gammaproteobacteria bacterium]
MITLFHPRLFFPFLSHFAPFRRKPESPRRRRVITRRPHNPIPANAGISFAEGESFALSRKEIPAFAGMAVF